MCMQKVQNHVSVKFLFIPVSGIRLAIFLGSCGSHQAASEPTCLSTMTQADAYTRPSSLVHADALHIELQRQTTVNSFVGFFSQWKAEKKEKDKSKHDRTKLENLYV